MTRRTNFKKVQNIGSVEGGKGGFQNVVEKFTFDSTKSAQKVKLIIPSVEDQPLLYELPFHTLNTRAENKALLMPKKDGGTYTPFEFACIHHAVQRPGAKKDELKRLKEEEGKSCPLCDIYYAERRKFYSYLETEHPNFDTYDKNQKRNVYKTFEDEQQSVYPAFEMVNGEFRVNAKRRLVVAVLDDNTSNYTLKYMDVSLARLEAIQSAIAQAAETGTYPENRLDSFKNAEGETEYNITGVELLFTYPKGSKMEAGRNLSIGVIAPSKSRTADEDSEVLKKINDEVAEKLEAIDKQIENDYHLKERTHDEIMEFINKDYYNELMAQYPPKPYVEGEDKKETKDTKTTKKTKKAETEVVEDVEDLFAD